MRPRQRAIEEAVEFSRRGDVILVAGKGHEKYQIIGEKRLPFDDVYYLRLYLNRVF